MSVNWKPGDVAHIELTNGYVHEVAVKLPLYEGGWASGRSKYVHSAHVRTARRLVVIDPEDRKQVERLDDLLWATNDETEARNDLQAALREFANPTPPRPDEPTGLGAVVEDTKGVKWVRSTCWDEPRTLDYGHWACERGDLSEQWEDIAVVRVLSPGVTS